jgi:hypothetical protein
MDEMGGGMMLRTLVASFPLWQHGFLPRSGHVGFVVDRLDLGQVSSKSSDFLS